MLTNSCSVSIAICVLLQQDKITVFNRIRDDIEERIHQVMNHKSCTNIDIGTLPFKAEPVSTGIKKLSEEFV